MTRSSSSGGLTVFDGTQSLGASVLTGASDCLAMNSSVTYGVSFTVVESDLSCGPGRYSLTQLSLAVSNASASVLQSGFLVQLYSMNASTSRPLRLITTKGVSALPIPVGGGYVTLALSGLFPDTSGVFGSQYAIVFSSVSPVLWCSVSSSSSDRVPTSGIAVVNGSYLSFDLIGWSPVSPYRGVSLKAMKVTCASSTSQSQTATASSSPSPASATGSASQSPTSSQTPSVTGFPVQFVIDNTKSLSANISVSSFRSISSSVWRGVSLHWPESDPVCGPGKYALTSMRLPLSMNASLDSGTASVVVTLYVAGTVTHLPDYPVRASFFTPEIPATPGFVPLDFSPPWELDVVVQRDWVLAVSVDPQVNWHDTMDGVLGHTPATGFAQAVDALVSVDGSGSEWTVDPSYGGIILLGAKTACSPSPSQTQSRSSSPTPSPTAKSYVVTGASATQRKPTVPWRS